MNDKLDFVGVQKVRAGDCNFFYGKGNKNHEVGAGFLIHHRIISAVKRVDFVSDRVSYIVLRGRWCNISVLNVHAPSEEKNDYSKDSFYEELEQVFDHFPKYHMKIFLGGFNPKVRRENIFKPTIGNESLHQDSNYNGVRIVNFAPSKNPVVKSTLFLNIHKYFWTSVDGETHKQIEHIPIDRRWRSSVLDVQNFRGTDCDTDHYLVVAKVRKDWQ